MEKRHTSVGLRGKLEKSNCANVEMQSPGMGRTRVFNDKWQSFMLHPSQNPEI